MLYSYTVVLLADEEVVPLSGRGASYSRGGQRGALSVVASRTITTATAGCCSWRSDAAAARGGRASERGPPTTHHPRGTHRQTRDD